MFFFWDADVTNHVLFTAGLSWLIGGSLTEVLTSIIFLFIKHPFDVGDRVEISKSTYTIKEIRLLTTIMVDSTSTTVQAPNKVLNDLVGAISDFFYLMNRLTLVPVTSSSSSTCDGVRNLRRLSHSKSRTIRLLNSLSN